MGSWRPSFKMICQGIILTSLIALGSAAVLETKPFFDNQSKSTKCAAIPNFMKIVGGEDADAPIPWQGSLQKNGGHFCGGTILDEYTVLSAAHCFTNDGLYWSNVGLKVVTGTVNSHSASAQKISVNRVIWNQQPRFSYQDMNNDMVLLKLESALDFGDTTYPSHLQWVKVPVVSNAERRNAYQEI